MSATPKSSKVQTPISTAKTRLFRAVSIFLLALANLHADDAPNPIFVQRAEKNFFDAKANLLAHAADPAALAQLARTAFDWADIQTSNAPRKSIADQGIAAARQLITADPASVPGHYYLGMDLGELAETETVGALKLVHQMETEFTFILHTNANFDYAGADRNLGLLYRDCPGWPISIGDRAKARQHLLQAYALAPTYPESLLNLIESELKWEQPATAREHLTALDTLWPKARQQFTGEPWEPAWADWTKRRDAARQKLSNTPATAASPHDKTTP